MELLFSRYSEVRTSWWVGRTAGSTPPLHLACHEPVMCFFRGELRILPQGLALNHWLYILALKGS